MAQFDHIRPQLPPQARSPALFDDFEERGEDEVRRHFVDMIITYCNENGIEFSHDLLSELQERVASAANVVPAHVRTLNVRDGSIIVDFRVHFGKKAEAEKFRDTLLRNAPASLAPPALGAFEIQSAVVGRVVTKQMIGSLWFALGYAHYERKGMKSCEASYEPYTRCIELDPTHAEAHSNLGILLRDVRKDYDGAIEMFQKAIALDSSYALPRWDLALLLETQKNDVSGAIKLVEECVRLGGVPGMNCEQRLAEPVQLRAVLGLGGLDHKGARDGPRHRGAVEPVPKSK